MPAWQNVPSQAPNTIADASWANAIVSNMSDSGWLTPTLLNSYTASTPVAYRMIGNQVFLCGSLTTGSSNETAFTLPSGFYNSGRDWKFPASSGIAANAATAAWVQVDDAGNVIPEFSTSSADIITLDGISFTVD